MPERKHHSGEAYYTSYDDQPRPLQASTSTSGSEQRRLLGEPAGAETSNPQRAGTNLSFRPSVFSRRSTGTQGPAGLKLLYAPSKPHSVDIIFLHGLGGSSRGTWSLKDEPDSFWPQDWLPDEPEINSARILTFGYNADFRSRGANNLSSISDFARALLCGMKFGKDPDDLNVGKKPIIFVVHSMGGLVLKKACVQGHCDQNYKDIVEQIRAVLFLSTPHRGTKLADFLNGLLSLGFFTGHHPKQFINELSRNSPSIEELNQSFRHFAPTLQIFSFYETVETSIAGRNTMLLDTCSSTLGYPGEITYPLDANHHDVCKYSSRQDPNYQSVSSVLRELVKQYKDSGSQTSRTKSVSNIKKVENLLGIDNTPQRDYTSLLHRCKEGTCRTILTDPIYKEWERGAMHSRIL